MRLLSYSVAIALLAAIVIAMVWGISFWRDVSSVMSTSDEVRAEMTDLQDRLERGDVSGANALADLVCSQAEAMMETCDSWSWTIAVRLPIVGGDVEVARGLVYAMDALTSQVVFPITSKLSSLAGGIVSGNVRLTLDNISTDLYTLGEFIDVLDETRPVIDEVDALVQDLRNRDIHIEKLREGVDEAADRIGDLRERFDEVRPVLDSAISIKALVEELLK